MAASDKEAAPKRGVQHQALAVFLGPVASRGQIVRQPQSACQRSKERFRAVD
jgi:hypothetical protein